MPTKGTYTAYNQLRPLAGSVSDDIQTQQENAFRRRALDQVEERTQMAKDDAEAKRKQDLWDKYVKPLSNYDTGSKSLNEVQGRLILEAQKEYVPLMAVLNNPNSSEEAKLKATLKLDNINKLPENMLAMTKSLTQRDLAIKKGVQDGTLWANPDYDKNFQEGFGNKILALDEYGMPMIAFNNPDGSRDLETYDQIQNAVNKYDFEPRYDRETELLEASKKLVPVVNQTDDGRQRVETTAVDSELLRNYVNNQLFESDGVTPTAKLKSFAKEAGVPLSDANGIEKLARGFENDIRLRVKGGEKVTRNYNNLDVQKEARAAAKDKIKEANTTVSQVTVPPIYEESGVIPANGYKAVSIQNAKPITSLRVPNSNNKNKIVELAQATPISYVVVENENGVKSLNVEISYQTKKGTTEDFDTGKTDDNGDKIMGKRTVGAEYATTTVPMTEKDAVKIARSITVNGKKLETVNDLKRLAKDSDYKGKSTKTAKKVYAGVDENGKIIYK